MLQSGRHMRSTEVRSWSVVQAGVVYMGRELQFFIQGLFLSEQRGRKAHTTSFNEPFNSNVLYQHLLAYMCFWHVYLFVCPARLPAFLERALMGRTVLSFLPVIGWCTPGRNPLPMLLGCVFRS
jgi:hypothetical protein